MAFLYFLSSIYLAGVYINNAVTIAHFFGELELAGYPLEQYSHFTSYIIVILATLVFVSGTIGTLFYMYKSLNNSNEAS